MPHVVPAALLALSLCLGATATQAAPSDAPATGTADSTSVTFAGADASTGELVGPNRGLRWEMAFNAKTLVDPFNTDTAPGLEATPLCQPCVRGSANRWGCVVVGLRA